MINKNKVVPPLPNGIKVVDRPCGLEFLQRGNERWVLAIQALDALDSMKCLEIDITGLSKGQVNAMKNSIKHAGMKLGHKGKIRYAIKGNVLLVWSNK